MSAARGSGGARALLVAAVLLVPVLGRGVELSAPAPSIERMATVLERAERDLSAADASDRLFVRLARRFQSMPAPVDASACAEPVRAALVARIEAALAATAERLAAAGARMRELDRAVGSEGGALLAPSDLRRIEAARKELARLRHLLAADRAILASAIHRPLRRAGCEPARTAALGRALPSGGPEIPAPPPFVPDTTVAIGLQAGQAPTVAWLDGVPVRVLGPGELGVVAVPAGRHALCASALEAHTCTAPRIEELAMGRWFVVRPGAVRPVGGGLPPAPEPSSRPPPLPEDEIPEDEPLTEPPAEPPDGEAAPT